MYFKRLELNGFKSFADPVVIEFTQGITCIVGPNGSGKSNISDAIRWVLGEQSPKMLRGNKMDEVIFAGTQNRKAKGMAEVTLVIDNSDHSLNIEFAEVAITRRMYRSGESEYLINKSICRLKDIRELIMDTGIGVEGYSIIGQGKIADIVSNKMDSRREIFEEAAGVVKYRTKKDEAERKLEASDINLSRVNDIVYEIESRIDGLREESEKAAEYLEIKEKYTDIEINIILKNIEQAEEKAKAIRDELDELDESLEKAEGEKEDLEEKLRKERNKNLELEEKLNFLRGAYNKSLEELHELSSREEVNKEKLATLNKDAERLNEEIEAQDEKIAREEKNAEALAQSAEAAMAESEALAKELKSSEEASKKAVLTAQQANEKLAGAVKNAENIRLLLSKLNARYNLLDELEKSYEGYNGGVKFLMDRKLKGVIGALGDLLVVPRGLELAVETVLGGKLQNIVCQNDTVASDAIDILKSNKAGRLTFLPVDNLRVQPPLSVEGLKNEKGFVGLGSEKVSIKGGYQDIVDYVLGNVVFVDNLDNALSMSHKNDGPHKFVTLDGEIINSAGALTGGSLKNNTGNILARRGEKDQLAKEIEKCKKDLDAADKQIDGAKKELEAANFQDAKDAENSLRLKQNTADMKVESAKDLVVRVRSHIEELKQEKLQKEQALRRALNEIEQIKEFSGGAVELLETKEEEKKEAERLIEAAEKEKLEAGKAAAQMEDELRIAGDKLYDIQIRKHEADVKIARYDTQTESLKEKLWDEFEMSYAQAAEKEDPDFNLGRAQRESREYKDRLREIGDVNVGSIQEYKEVSERYTFLTQQRDDITKAMDELRKVISDMDKIIKERFKENFDNVVVNFEETFRELFKGGHARLSMDDPDNPLESAIEIEAQPPGKKLQNMNLLSGGEKTLTAIALMFAVLKSKPTPFCILDEIEAALDEANIDTVANYIRSFTGSQFALITHQKLTMEYADVLYGVTMPENGITQVLSLKLGDEVEL